jgi:CHAD domain-containing protein
LTLREGVTNVTGTRGKQAHTHTMAEPRAQRVVESADLPPDPPAGTAATPAAVCRPVDPFIVFAYSALRRELAALMAARPRQIASPTPDEIHRLRVAARRLRVALRLFRRMLPSKDVVRLRTDLRWFARALGDVRDLDVYTDNFRAYSQQMPPEQQRELGGYELYLRRERAEARSQLPALFADPRYAALCSEAVAFLATGPRAGALRRWRSLSVRDGIRDSALRSVNRVRRLGNRLTSRSKAADIHELRIRAKRLRYELEFFAEVYPALKQPAQITKTLQDLLGSHQDACTATARLRRYANAIKKAQATPSPLPPALIELRRNQLRLARTVRQSFAAEWQVFLALVGDAPSAVA